MHAPLLFYHRVLYLAKNGPQLYSGYELEFSVELCLIYGHHNGPVDFTTVIWTCPDITLKNIKIGH